MVMEDGVTLDGGHTRQYEDHVSQKYTLEAYIILSTNVTSIHFIKRKKKVTKREYYVKTKDR